MSRIEVFGSPGELAEAMAEDIAGRIRAASGLGRRSGVALSGGSTPRLTLEALARLGKGVDWSMVDLFWVDERCVPPDHPDSNYGMARDALLAPARVPKERVHRIRGEDDPDAESARYSSELEAALADPTGAIAPGGAGSAPTLDLILLGLGDDGHTASIFPYNAGLYRSGRLFEVSVHPTSGQRRVTMTGRLIAAARSVAFVVAGPGKAQRVAEIVGRSGQYREYPAWLADEARGGADWRLDRAAASLLKESEASR